MKKNGFTLIELLAVIVILSIIALIAIPVVMNVISNAKRGAAKDSAYGVLKAAQNYYGEKLLDTQGSVFDDITFTCNGEECAYQDVETAAKETLKIKGTIPTSGTILVSSLTGAKIASPLVINSYYCNYVDAAKTAIDCATTLSNLDESSETTPEEIKISVIENLYPVGSIYISTSSTNPSEYLGVGTWVSYAEGRTLVGVGEGTDANNISQTFTVGQTGGEYNHTLTVNEMPSHSHTGATATGSTDNYYSGGKYAETGETGTTGGNQPHNNIQPYVAVYMWQRTE